MGDQANTSKEEPKVDESFVPDNIDVKDLSIEEPTKVEEPSEPKKDEPTEVKKDDDTQVDDSEELPASFEEVINNTITPKESKKKEEPVKEELTKETTKAPVDTKPKARSYEGLNEEESKMFRAMSNEAYAKLYPQYLEHKEIQQKLQERDNKIKELETKGVKPQPKAFYEHEQGFLLDPEFQSTVQNLQAATAVAQHWQKQLTNIRKNARFQDLETDPKTGQLVLGQERDATDDDESTVLGYIGHANAQLGGFKQQLQSIQTSYKDKYVSATDVIKQAEDTYFAPYKDPKHPDYEIINRVIENMPPAFKDHPLTMFSAKAFAAASRLRDILVMVQAQSKKRANKDTQATLKAGPSLNDLGGVGSGEDKNSVPDYNEFEQIINGQA